MKEEITLLENDVCCMATHPVTPNMTNNMRGRSIHLVKEGNKTMCNMLVTKVVNKGWLEVSRNKFCQICFKNR